MATNSCKQKKIRTAATPSVIIPLQAFLIILTLCCTTIIATAEELHIYYSNDMHGKVEPCG